MTRWFYGDKYKGHPPLHFVRILDLKYTIAYAGNNLRC